MQNTRELFASRDLRCTSQRVALYESLSKCKTHPTAEELHQLVNTRSDIKLSLATVYNTLDVLCQVGLAQRMPSTNGCCRYDADVSDHIHVRLVETGEIADVPPDLSRKLLDNLPQPVLDEIEQKLGVDITSVSISLTADRSDGD